MKVFVIVSYDLTDRCRVEKVFACRHKAVQIRDRYQKRQVDKKTFHIVTQKVCDLHGLSLKKLLKD